MLADNDTPESARFRHLIGWVLDHRLVVAALVLLMTVAAGGVAAKRLILRADLTAFLENNNTPAMTALEDFRERFGRDDLFLVLVEGDVFSEPFLRKLEAMGARLEALDVDLPEALELEEVEAPVAADADFDGFDDFDAGGGDAWAGESGGSVIDDVLSLINVQDIRGDTMAGGDVEIAISELMTPWPTDMAAFKAKVLADETRVGRLVAADGRHAMAMVRTAVMSELNTVAVHGAMVELLAEFDGPDFVTSLAGPPALGASLRARILSEIQRLFLLSTLCVLTIMIVLFRRPPGVIGPGLVVVLSAVWTFGFMAALGMPVTMLSVILPAFIVAVGIGDSVHILSVYRDQLRDGSDVREVIIYAVASTAKPILYTTLTTVFGLISFNLATVGAVRQMGNAGAFGVASALFLSVLVLPLVLSLDTKGKMVSPEATARPSGYSGDAIDRFLDFCTALSGRRFSAPKGTPVHQKTRLATLAVTLILIGFAAYGTSKLRVWHDPLTWLPEGDPVRVAFDIIDRELGGAGTIQLIITPDGDAEDIRDVALIHGVKALEAYARSYRDPNFGPVVLGSIGVIEVLERVNGALHGDAPGSAVLPIHQREMTDIFSVLENSDRDGMRLLVTPNYDTLQLTLRVRWLEATSYGPLADWLELGIEEHLGGHAKVRATGTAYTLFNTVSMLISNVIRSFGLAVLLISIFMVLLLREIRLGLIAMVPNLIPILFTLGIMGFADIRIDLSNLLVASVAIGLAVDDTIHFLFRFKAHFEIHGDTEAAISDAMVHAGRAIVGTTLILGVGFLCFLGAELGSLQRFGLLTAMTAGLALLVDLIVGPALLRTVYGAGPGATRNEPGAAPTP